MSRRISAGRGALAVLGILLLALGALLTSCGGSEEGSGNASSTTAQPNEEGSGKESPSNEAQAAAAAIDEPSIHESLVYLTGASPAPLASGPTTIAERGSEDGRRTAAQYMKESFEAEGVPARILEFTSDYGRGFNVEATLQGTEGQKHLWMT